MAARKYYGGYSITHLREWARELGVAGRTRMAGDELLVATFAASDAQLLARETAALAGGPVKGAHFEMECGCVIVATTDPLAHRLPVIDDRPPCADRLFVRGQYVALCEKCRDGRRADWTLKHKNEAAERDSYRFFLWSLTRVTFVTDMNEDRITVGARVESYAGHSDGEQGTVEGFDANGWPIVEFDFRPGDAFECNPTHLAVVPPAVAHLTRDEARLLGTYLAGPRIWDAAALLSTVVGLTEKGMIAPVGEGPAHAITVRGRIVVDLLAPVGA